MREAPAAPYDKAVYLYQIAGYLPRGASGTFLKWRVPEVYRDAGY
jgi:hypothetical protein